MRLFGLIGKKLGHSFSQQYFTDKFEKLSLNDHRYQLFELSSIHDLPDLIHNNPQLAGLNVTIPYKEEVISLLDSIDEQAEAIGAVNVVKIENGKLHGFNSDYYGFKTSLQNWLPGDIKDLKALILGTGGASKAVAAALQSLNIPYSFVSRSVERYGLTYQHLMDDQEILIHHKLIINTTPLGMYPNLVDAPELPYHRLSPQYYLYDLVYNPEITIFMNKGAAVGANTMNGLAMLHLQAEKSWDIWNG